MIVADQNSVNFITVDWMILEEIGEKEIEVAFYNMGILNQIITVKVDFAMTTYVYERTPPPPPKKNKTKQNKTKQSKKKKKKKKKKNTNRPI